jgi:hypothetical protein
MANKLSTAQQNLVIESLTLDKASNYSRLEYYLKQIIAGRDVVFETRSDQPFIVSSQEAWSIIVSWSQSEGNLPVGDRGSRFNAKSRAAHLLDYLQTNISGKTAEAAASYQLILEQANNKIASPLPSQKVNDYNLQKIYDLRHLQIEIQQAGLIGKIYTNLEKTKILEGVPKESRNYVLRMLSAANQNFRYGPKHSYQDFTPEKIHQLLLHTPGIRDTNQIMRLFYSKAAQKDIATIRETISQAIQEEYGTDDAKYQSYMDSVRNISSLSPSLSNIDYLVNSINIHATPEEKAQLIRSLRSQLVSSAMGEHQGGDTLLKRALVSAGFPESNADYYKSLVPYLEEIEVKQRHLLLGSELSERDSRLLSTASLATELGVDLSTPWRKKKDLDSATEKILKEFGVSSLQEAFDAEYAGNKDLSKLVAINELMGMQADHKRYHDSLAGNFWYKVREGFDKGVGNYLAVRQPVDRFTRKVWGGIENIDDTIRWPQRKLANWLEKTQEKYPWLNPAQLIARRWTGYQTGIALKIHSWALSVGSTSWFSGFAGNIADFTEGFIKHEGNWGGAGTFFFQRKIGNTLDWAAKNFTKHETFKGVKASIANTLWSGFSKAAPGLSAKLTAGVFGEVIAGFLLGELTLGTSIAIQIGFEVLRAGFSVIKKFLTDPNFRNKVIDRIPLLVGGAITSVGLFLSGIPSAILAGIGITGAAILAFLQAAIMSLAPLFALAATIALGVTAFFALIWFGIISPSFKIDSGVGQVITSIICDENGGDGNPSINTAMCIVKILSECGINPLTSGNANSSKWQCALAGLVAEDAMGVLKKSASDYAVLQCVGFVAAIDVAGGGSGQFPHAKLMDAIHPSNYRFVGGVGSCSPGDIFVDKNGDWGHTGIFMGVTGPTIKCIDANGGGPGQVRGVEECTWLTSKIAGCLKKM